MDARCEVSYRHSGVTVLSSKVICGCCGSTYGPRPWHSTSYNNPVWQCRERVKKNGACNHRTNIYDKLLHYCIHDVARNLAIERGVIKTVRRILFSIIDASRHAELRRWFRDFRNRDAWTFLSDEDDLSMIICKIIVMPKGALKFELLDGTALTYRIPKYKPSRGIVNE